MAFFERLKAKALTEWRAYTEHPSQWAGRRDLGRKRVSILPDAGLPVPDRVCPRYALSVYKAPRLQDMRDAASGLSAILDVEMNLHVKLCAGWGLSARDLEEAPAAPRR